MVLKSYKLGQKCGDGPDVESVKTGPPQEAPQAREVPGSEGPDPPGAGAADLLFPQRRSEAAGSGRSLGLNAATQHSPSTWWIEVDWVRLF